jgi:DNA-binding beta-propeller fold protein YncE/cytochrome c peroxidase
MRTALIRRLRLCSFGFVTFAAGPAVALTVDVSTREPSQVGESFTFRAVVTDAVGVPQFRWNFGDGTRTVLTPGDAAPTHSYATPGHYTVLVLAQDDSGPASLSFPHTVHYPLTAKRPTASTSIVYDQQRNRIYSANQDNDSITSVDPIALTKVAELGVYRRPEALAMGPDGKLWVVHQDDYAVAIVDPGPFVIERGFRLPYASQPVGLAMSPVGDAAYVTLMALGRLLKLDSTTGSVVGEVDVGPSPRGVSVSHDGRQVYVTRFISPDTGGEVVEVDGSTLQVRRRIQLPPDTTTNDTDQQARGLPNYLFSVSISPDGRQGWVASKKDNVFRGIFRDGLALTQDDTVRPMVAIVDLANGVEDVPNRIDMDDRTIPAHVEFSPRGDFAFVTLVGSNMIEVRDVYNPSQPFTIISNAAVGPRAVVLGPQNRLFVQGWLGRDVVVYDLSAILVSSDKATPGKLADISTVNKDKLEPRILLGKQIFHGAADIRMTSQGYLTCGTCHFEGIDDGRVFDFTSRGEGLRNTPSLLGRKGTGQGRLDWSGNFDEVQDFERQIRELFGGKGFISDDVLAVGTRKEALGDSKAGLSTELDAVAAYLMTLDHVNPSPFRNSDGSLTADAETGKALFSRLGCPFCHGGPDFTDSTRGMLHDVGTIAASSGNGSGVPLSGIDTPTLLGVWETAPYLHDGSAATLRDVLTTRNPNDQHGFVSSLQPKQIDQLTAYLLQLDNALPISRLPFESMPQPDTSHPMSGQGCACQLTTPRLGAPSTEYPCLLVSLWWLARRQRRSTIAKRTTIPGQQAGRR